MGEIVVKEMDTPDNHRRLAEIRAGELEAAMGELGVTEWESLGYRETEMIGRARQPRSAQVLAGRPRQAVGRLVWLDRQHRPDVITTYNDFGGYGHPDHIRTHLVASRSVRAGRRSHGAYAEQLGPRGRRGRRRTVEAPWETKLYVQATPASVRRAMIERMEAAGGAAFLLQSPPEDATPEQIAEYEGLIPRTGARAGRDGSRPASTCRPMDRGEVAGDPAPRHADQPGEPLHQDGPGGVLGRGEAYVLRESEGAERTCPSPTSSRASEHAVAPGLTEAHRSPLEQQVAEHLAHHHPAVAGRVEEVRLGLVENDVRPHPGLDEGRPVVNVSSRVIPSIVGIGPRLVEDEVAEGVPDRPALVDLDRAGPVGVVADDEVGTGVDRGSGQPLLAGKGGRVVLGAPVRKDDHHFGAGLAGGLDVGAAIAAGDIWALPGP